MGKFAADCGEQGVGEILSSREMEMEIEEEIGGVDLLHFACLLACVRACMSSELHNTYLHAYVDAYY